MYVLGDYVMNCMTYCSVFLKLNITQFHKNTVIMFTKKKKKITYLATLCNPNLLRCISMGHPSEWCSQLEALAVLPVTPRNDSRRDISRKVGVELTIDITFISDSPMPRSRWTLGKNYSNSDPQVIFLNINDGQDKLTGHEGNITAFDERMSKVMMSSHTMEDGTSEQLVREMYTVLIEGHATAEIKESTSPLKGYVWKLEDRSSEGRFLKPGKCLRRKLKNASRSNKRRCCKTIDLNPWRISRPAVEDGYNPIKFLLTKISVSMGESSYKKKKIICTRN